MQQHGLHLIPKDLVYVGLQQGTPRFFQDRKLNIALLVQLLVFAFDAAFLALGKVKKLSVSSSILGCFSTCCRISQCLVFVLKICLEGRVIFGDQFH